MSVCIQALQAAIRYNELMQRSETTADIDFEESSLMYERELVAMVGRYQEEERQGNAQIRLAGILHAPFTSLLDGAGSAVKDPL